MTHPENPETGGLLIPCSGRSFFYLNRNQESEAPHLHISHSGGQGREQRGAGRLAGRRPEVDEVIKGVERLRGEGWLEFEAGEGTQSRPRVVFGPARVRVEAAELARATRMRGYSAVAMAIKRFEARLKSNGVERKQLKELSRQLRVEL